MNSVNIIIQARVGSKRFPFKVLKKISKNMLIEWVILRLKKIKNIKIILATTNKQEDDFLIKVAKKNNILYFRGSTNNVLKRTYEAAKLYNSKNIVRVCADNPFVDPKHIKILIKKFLNKKCDYGFNHLNQLDNQYADGFGAEIISFNTLKKLNTIVHRSDHKEHVTKYIWDNQSKFNILPVKAPKKLAYPNLRFDINTKKDYKLIKSIVNEYNININTTAEKIIEYKLTDKRKHEI